MAIQFPLPTLFFCTVVLFSTTTTTAQHDTAPQDLIRSSCVHASYPDLCLRTLSSYSGPTTTPREVAQAAVKVSLVRTRRVSSYLTSLQASSRGRSKRERGAVSDCVEQLAESVEELGQTLGELKHLRGQTFQWQMSNAETWASAALTNEDTCLDGFEGVYGKLKSDVKKKMTNVARMTSNALYMINLLDESRRSGNRLAP